MFCEVYPQSLLFKKINPNSFPALNKNTLAGIFEAGGEGVEPPHTDSESAVLPLDEPPRFVHILPDDFPPYKSNFMPPAASYPCACGCFLPAQSQAARLPMSCHHN